MINLENVSKSYISDNKKIDALSNVSMNIKKGCITGIIGESGAGKSTILQLLTGIIKPDLGDIYVDGENILKLNKKELNSYRKKLGVVFQDYNLLSNINIIDNVTLPLKLNKVSKEERYKKGYELLDFIGLKNEALSYPSQLSGGEKQRVAIARSLITDPKILLLDEITSALDQENSNIIINLLKEINKKTNITILFISHDLLSVKYLCRSVYVISNGVIEDNFVIKNTNTEFNYKKLLLGDLND